MGIENDASPSSGSWTPRLRSSPAAYAAAGAAVLLVAALIYLTVRLFEVDSRLEAIDARLERTAALVTQIGEQARLAGEKAAEAERNSKLSEQARRQAESERDGALLEASEARQEAVSARGEAEAATREKEEVLRQREEDLNRLQSNLNRITETRRTALGLVMNLGEDALRFDFDKAELRPQGRELLSRILGILLTADKGYGVYVYGHTDDLGSAEYNQQLSLRRAEAVRDYLAEAGLDPAIITVRGFGKSRPLVAEATPQARAKNRRVEIGIIHTDIRFEHALADQ